MTPRRVLAPAIDDVCCNSTGSNLGDADVLLAALSAAGFVIVPKEPTKEMIAASCDAIRKREEEMGDAWFPVSTKAKALLRWDAMIAASQEPRDD